jgi:myo-inositol-1(or 4)-monophosphatase
MRAIIASPTGLTAQLHVRTSSGRTAGMTESLERELLDVATAAARAAAIELRERFGRHADGVRAKSTPTDLVSDADLAAEAAIRGILNDRRPGDSILAEEGGASGDGDLRWIVDPLDGTINFLFGIPVFAVSIACEDRAGTLVGVVLDPNRDECFTATRSGAPRLNGAPLTPARRADSLSEALVATGFGYDSGVRARQAEVVASVIPLVRDIRRAGAAALDLCWSAAGRYDAYYERGLHAWDLAAGGLVAERAGLELRRLPATAEDPWGVAVAPPALIDDLLALVA